MSYEPYIKNQYILCYAIYNVNGSLDSKATLIENKIFDHKEMERYELAKNKNKKSVNTKGEVRISTLCHINIATPINNQLFLKIFFVLFYVLNNTL